MQPIISRAFLSMTRDAAAHFTSGALAIALLLALPMTSAALTKKETQAIFEAAQFNPRQLIRQSELDLRFAEARMDSSGEIRALLGLATARQFLLEFDALALDAARGAELARESGDRDALCWFLVYSGLSQYRKGNLDANATIKEANKHFDEAIALDQKHAMPTCLGWVHLARSKIFNVTRMTSDAVAAGTKAHALFDSEGDRFGMAAALTDIATNVVIRNNKQDAEMIREYLDRAASLVDFNTYRVLAAENILFHGHNEYFLQNMQDARVRFGKAAAISREVQFDLLTGAAERELGEVAKLEKRYSDAFRHGDLALQMLEKHPDKRQYIKALLLRAEVLAKFGRRSESTAMLDMAQAALSRINDPSSTRLYYFTSPDIYADLNDFQAAFRQMKALQKVQSQLNALRRQDAIDELKVRFDVALTESENARLVAERQEAESRRLALILGLTLTVVLSVAILGGVVLYMRKRAADVRIEMAHQKQLAAAEAAANHAKSEFLANMSHELRSPLNAILGFSQIAARRPGLPDDAHGDLQTVLQSGEHLYRLINQILDLSKIEAGLMTLNDTVFNLPLLLDELEQMFSLTARQKRLALTIERASDLPLRVRADAVKLRQLLINLTSNALKFTVKGGVKLSVRRSGTHYLSIMVSDTGPGIPADELHTLGNSFVQAGEGRRSREGTGLGLAICNRFVKLMGGELRMSSEVGKGSHFSFEIRMTEVDEPGLYSQVHPSGRRVIGLAPGQRRYRILAVDDRPEQRRLLCGLLGPIGFDVREASTGEEAVAVWEEWSPDLIWMDMRMPVLNGMAATRRIKSTEKGKSTVIIALTASTFEDERDEILGTGCDDFLRKPFQEQAMFSLLHQHLGVDFVYEHVEEEKLVNQVRPAQITALPAVLRENLEAALAGLDTVAIDRAIMEVRTIDAELADTLGVLAAKFDYGRILDMLAVREQTFE